MALSIFKIATVEVASPATSIDFASIPQGYTDLKIVMSARNTNATVDSTYVLKLNSTNGTSKVLYANGASVGSLSSITVWGYVNAASSTANSFSSTEIYLPNYTSSAAKSASVDNVDETNATNAAMSMVAGVFSSVTSAVTSISLLACDNNQDNNRYFLPYTTATLYGIL